MGFGEGAYSGGGLFGSGGLFVKMGFRGGGLFGRGGGLNGRGAYKIMQKSSVQNNKKNDFNTT